MNAIITGGTKGIGKAIAMGLAKEGYDVAVCARKESDLVLFQNEMKELYPTQEVLVKACDMSNQVEVESFAAFVKENWKQVDILVNNAGMYAQGTASQEPDGTLERVMATNFYGAYYLTRSILKAMVPYEKGLVVSICSIAAKQLISAAAAYSLSKMALYGFTQLLREELKPKGIKVSAIFPGSTWSSSWEGNEDLQNKMVQPEDIANAIIMMSKLSDSAVIDELMITPKSGQV